MKRCRRLNNNSNSFARHASQEPKSAEERVKRMVQAGRIRASNLPTSLPASQFVGGGGEKVIKVLRFGDERSVALGQSLCDELERRNSRPLPSPVESHFQHQRLANSANQEQEALLLPPAAKRQAVRVRYEVRNSKTLRFWDSEIPISVVWVRECA